MMGGMSRFELVLLIALLVGGAMAVTGFGMALYLSRAS